MLRRTTARAQRARYRGMNILTVLPVVLAVYFLSVDQMSRAQDFKDPVKVYKKMQFDEGVRGGFNLSVCLKDLFTCMETVRGDVMCLEKYKFESVCSYSFQYCNEEKGLGETGWPDDTLFENVCESNNYYT